MKLGDYLRTAAVRLEAAGVYSPQADAEIIVSKILNLPRQDIPANAGRVLTSLELDQIEAALARRSGREPLARIFEGTQFCGLPIRLEEGVFEPLAESESLIEHAVLFLQERKGALRILDLGTGTGCLLLGALSKLPRASGLGIDISEKAVDLARRNAAAAGLADRAQFQTGDWAKRIAGPFDLILSNPPFIPRRLIKGLVPEVRMHDPLAGLEGGRDGLRYYRRLAHDFPQLAAPGALGLFQISLTFAESVRGIFERAGYEAEIKRNHFGIPVGIGITEKPRTSLFARLLRGCYGW